VGAAWPLAGDAGGCSRGGTTKRPFEFPSRQTPIRATCTDAMAQSGREYVTALVQAAYPDLLSKSALRSTRKMKEVYAWSQGKLVKKRLPAS
jgi:hypothetical protein